MLLDYKEESEPLPRAGEYSVVLVGAGIAVCIIRTTSVEVRNFGEVDEQCAFEEGEGDCSLKYWRRTHINAFTRDDRPIGDATPMVLERFDLVWPQGRSLRAAAH